jgi:hypothetical protein
MTLAHENRCAMCSKYTFVSSEFDNNKNEKEW